ncbi:c-type cytochrome [Glaciecola sp. 2405UD65-10]|uniref:c-type cytochrome n=1 Tax=Glaciecola sp. 2405UD65-10 TaxID=3397244 RepID=UPI003B5C5FF8
MKKLMLISGVSLGLCLSSSVALADDHEPKAAKSEKQAANQVTFRKSILQLVRSNMGPLGAMAKGNIPMDAEVIETNAERIAFLGNMMHDYFSLDTSAFSVDTEAKSEIWKNYADFTSKTQDLVDAADNLTQLVASKEDSEYRKGIAKLGATCKACHDEYKQD